MQKLGHMPEAGGGIIEQLTHEMQLSRRSQRAAVRIEQAYDFERWFLKKVMVTGYRLCHL